MVSEEQIGGGPIKMNPGSGLAASINQDREKSKRGKEEDGKCLP